MIESTNPHLSNMARRPVKHNPDQAVPPLPAPKTGTERITASVNAAQPYAQVWTTSPQMDHYPGPVRGLARIVGKMFLYLAQVVTKPQQRYNIALLDILQSVNDSLRSLEQYTAALNLRLSDLATLDARHRNLEIKVDQQEQNQMAQQSKLASSIDHLRDANEADHRKFEEKTAALMNTLSTHLPEIRALTTRIDEVAGQLTNFMRLEDRINVLAGQVPDHEAKLKDLTTRLGAVSDRLSDLSRVENRIDAVLSRLPDQQAQVQELASRVGKISERLSDLSRLQTRIDALADRLPEQQTKTEELTARVTAVSTRLEDLLQMESRINAVSAHLPDQQTKLQELATRVGAVSDRLSGLLHMEETLAAVSNRIPEQQSELQQLTNRIGSISSQLTDLVRLGSRLDALSSHPEVLQNHEQRLREMTIYVQSLLGLEPRLSKVQEEISRMMVTTLSQEHRLAVVLEEARKALPKTFSTKQLQLLADELDSIDDELYVSFEDRFRGSRDDIKRRVEVYLPLIRKARAGLAKSPVLDVGCGRGEWLELLREQGLIARGIDANRKMVERCRALKLNVDHTDAMAYLRNQSDVSLGAITGFHIIEHLPFKAWLTLFDEALRTLKPGGIMIFETPNPGNVLVGSNNFYLDPTHRNPLPGALVKYIAETRGFTDTELLYLHPVNEEFLIKESSEVSRRFNELFYGPQDYAIIARKPTQK